MNSQLEKAYADETASLNPNHRFVPWVLVNNQPLQEVSTSISLCFVSIRRIDYEQYG